MIRQKDIRGMAVNVPTTWINSGMSDFDNRLFAAINDMLPDGTMNNDGSVRNRE